LDYFTSRVIVEITTIIEVKSKVVFKIV